MHLVILEKTIDVIDNIDDLNTVNLEENIEYFKSNNGISIKGYIDIEGDYVSRGQSKQFKDKLTVDLLAPYDEIIDKDAILLKINDFDYINGGNKIIFTFKLNIDGWKEVGKTFLSTDVSNENEEEAILIESNEAPEVVDKLKELLEECKKIDKKDECISEYLKHGLEEVEKIIEENNDENRNNLIKFNISGEDIEKEKLDLDSGDSNSAECSDETTLNENKILKDKDYKIADKNNLKEEYPIKIESNNEVEVKIPSKKEKNKNSLDSLFSSNNKKVAFCSYRVVYEGESYESIANEESISIYDLKRFNKSKELKEGVLIKIPLKK